MSYFWEYELDWWCDSEVLNDKGILCAKDEREVMSILMKYYGDDLECIKWIRCCYEGKILTIDDYNSEKKARYKLVEKVEE